ncbi:MAG: hypothetical protein LBQ40_07090, partial [Clostridiales bacterium]|nr:hypothetical protein [Clostridiales bacterium]
MEKKPLKWLKIDNSARIYPMLYGKKTQNIFRISCELDREVDPDVLTRALTDILPRYPSFNVKMRKGFFWYYFEENSKPPLVFFDGDVKIDNIDFAKNNSYIFRTTYFNRVFSIDFYHSVTDGRGGSEFIKALLLRYLELIGCDVDGEGIVKPYNSPPTKGEIEDSFLNNYRPVPIKDIELKGFLGGRGYVVKGVPLDDSECGIINGLAETSEIKRVAKKYGVTVTAYLGGLFMYSIYKTNYDGEYDKRPIKLMIPVNLRKIFPSKTLRNFTFALMAEAPATGGEPTLGYFVECVAAQLKKGLEPKSIATKVAGSVKLDKNLLVKLLPLPIKFAVFRAGQSIIRKISGNTAVLTNPGIIEMPESVKPYLKHMSMVLIPIKDASTTCAVLTYNGEMSLTFSRRHKDVEIVREFFGEMVREGLKFTLTSNYAETKVE